MLHARELTRDLAQQGFGLLALGNVQDGRQCFDVRLEIVGRRRRETAKLETGESGEEADAEGRHHGSPHHASLVVLPATILPR
jgi:hypothetical protein